MIDRREQRILRRLKTSKSNNFSELVRLAELSPESDFRDADLRGIDFGDANLSGFDFSGADLTGANLSRAKFTGNEFYRATMDQVIFPSRRDRLVRKTPAALRAFHTSVVQEVLKATRQANHIPNIYFSMQAGTGRHVLIEALLEALDESDALDDALVVVDSSAERDQVLRRFIDTFGRSVVGEGLRRSTGVRPRRLEVVTLSALMRWLDSDGKSMMQFSKRLNCLFTLTRGIINDRTMKRLKIVFRQFGVLSFGYQPVFVHSERLEGFDLDFHYGTEQAISDGLLDAAKVIRPVENIIETIKAQHMEAYGVVVVREEVGVEQAADDISRQLYEIGLNWRVVGYRDDLSLGLHDGLAGRLVVTRPKAALRLDWSMPDFTLVTAPISWQLGERIAFPRHRTNRTSGPIVFDFNGAMLRELEEYHE
ncbi:MAG: pentapeptide repeat-containing protein [Mesorhizobium sp.]|nr:MAG: pentapeptide repeat-containing protein [Mesorhizobium sp.]